MKKTILCLLLALGLLLLSAAAMADDRYYSIDNGNITIENGTSSDTLKVQYGTGEVDNIPADTNIYITGEPRTSPQLIIKATVPVKINYRVECLNITNTITISITDNADVTLTLIGDVCDASSTDERAGITLGSGSKLTIQADDPMTNLRIYGLQNAILGPSSDETPATVILNSGELSIDGQSGFGISGNVNLVINGGRFEARNTKIDVQNLIITGGELWAGSDSSTKVTYQNLSSCSNITCSAGILPNSVDYYIELVVFGELTLPVDLTIPDGKKLFLFSDSSLTIPDDRSLTCNGVNIYTDSTLTNEGTLTLNQFSILRGELTNKGTLIINSDLLMFEGGYLGTLTNTGTISGTGFIDPRLSQSQPTSLTVESFVNGTVTLKADGQGKTALEYSADGNSWTENPVFTVVIPDAGQTFHARFKADDHFYAASDPASITVYPVSLNANGGTIASGKDVGYYIAGQSTPLPAKDDMTRQNYSFAGWYDNSALTGSPVTAIGTTETGAKEYWARWVVVLTDPDGEIVSGDAAFAKLPPVTVPTL
ncbi:MAG: InlB B-repeat-containing protein, partial [Aristaeellaceae bacterium]